MPDLDSRLTQLEADVRALIRRTAEAEFGRDESQRAHMEHVEQLLLRIIDVLDGFDRVLTNVQARAESLDQRTRIWIGNFRAVRRSMEGVLKQEEVTTIEAEGSDFDPTCHAAGEIVKDPTLEDGTIVSVRKTGYRWRGRVLRKSEVVAVRNAE